MPLKPSAATAPCTGAGLQPSAWGAVIPGMKGASTPYRNAIVANQRFLLYLALAFLLYMIWLTWQRENIPPPPPVSPTASSLSQGEGRSLADAQDLPDLLPADTMEGAAPTMTEEVAQPPASAQAPHVQVRTDVLDVVIDTRGGDIRQLDTLTYPVSLQKKDVGFRLLHSDERIYIAQSGLRHDNIRGQQAPASFAPSHHEIYTAERSDYVLADGQDRLQVRLLWEGERGLRVEKLFTFYRGDFVIDVSHRVLNRSTAPWVGRQYQQLRHSPISEDRSWLRLPTYTGTAYYDGAYHKQSFDDIDDDPFNMRVTGGWTAILQHYFVSAWIAEPEEENQFYSKRVQANRESQYLIGMLSASQTVLPGAQGEFKRRLYAGPKLQHSMKKIAPGLDLSVDYGMFSILSKPLFWLLEWFHKLVGNWGVAIILVTIVVKAVFFKLSEASYKSMARMRKIQPRFQALRERYTDDKKKMNQAVMEMYKKEKINPLGGCLPILVQIPVFLALYWVLVESVELRQAPFMLWINDLSLRDPIFVLPVLMGITMYIQFKLNPAPPDPMQAKIFAMMPIMMTAFMAFFPAGLVLYWLVSNFLSIAQQYVITKRIEKADY